jgi:hypothetical protein
LPFALIWIKDRLLKSADLFSMTMHRRPAIRHCPVCRVAMHAAKSRDNLDDFDLFKCLTCEATIHEPQTRPRRSGSASEK